MMTGNQQMGRMRQLWCGASVVLLGFPALLGPPAAYLLAVTAVVAVLVVLLPLPLGRITLPVAALAATGLSVVTDVAYGGQQGLTLLWMPFEFTALLVLTGRLIRRVRRYAAPLAAAVALATVALPLRFTVRNPESGANGSLVMVVITLVPVACAVAVGGYLRSVDERRRRAVLRARREQRLDMARVLHDFVAHELTGMVLEVQAAQASPYEPDQMALFLGRLEESGLRALDQLDRALDTLRQPEEHPGATPEVGEQIPPGQYEDAEEPAHVPTLVRGLSDLPDLVTRFAESSSLPAKLDLDAELTGTLRRESDEVAYGMVIEALTNVRRHAPSATSVTVSAQPEGDDRVRVSVTDHGGGREGASGALLKDRQGGGTGLVGLRERFTVLGGELTAGPCEDGWRVTGTLPR
ncbi:histidine kinase [Streptomyces sp. NBC_00237]|uniref:sensor histidine kinase n=1 Tax=Streptomyces sp. NBC_00237 TaxID=2975687 RepID=UPI0022507E5A|nr:ATP-binding protein [Streptomyces sp. NBC_00237]MCX5206946.1 histidine kinase [Streptomyces sp. NBC_00237]